MLTRFEEVVGTDYQFWKHLSHRQCNQPKIDWRPRAELLFIILLSAIILIVLDEFCPSRFCSFRLLLSLFGIESLVAFHYLVSLVC